MVGGSTPRFFQAMLLGPWLARLRGRQVKCLTSQPNQSDLHVLKEMIEAGKVRPYVDRTYPLSQVPDAIRTLEQRQVRGKVAISIV